VLDNDEGDEDDEEEPEDILIVDGDDEDLENETDSPGIQSQSNQKLLDLSPSSKT